MKYTVSITMGCRVKSYGEALITCSSIGDELETRTVDLILDEPLISHRTANLAPSFAGYHAEVKLKGIAASRQDAVEVGKICNGIMVNYSDDKVEFNFEPIPEAAVVETEEEVEKPMQEEDE